MAELPSGAGDGTAEGLDEIELDCTGLICPLPVLRARKRLKDMEPGRILAVTATDKAAPMDFETFCREAGHTLLASTAADGVYRFRIAKGGQGGNPGGDRG